MNSASKAALYLGGFSTMALSNAVVPILSDMTTDSALQGAVYSAYFLGAFLMVFTAGWLSDKIGRAPLIKIGLAGTFLSAIIFWFTYPEIYSAVVLRFAEGVFTGIFVSAALSFVNSQEDHKKLSGVYVALLNLGMVAGLVLTGFTSSIHAYSGVLIFGIITGVAAVFSVFFKDAKISEGSVGVSKIFSISKYHLWLWIGICIFTGTTGVVTSMYPEMSGYSPEITGIITALMSIATAVSIYIASRTKYFSGLKSVRLCAAVLAVSVPLSWLTPFGMILLGIVYGFICVAVMNYIAETGEPQGVMNGLYYTVQYAGMALLPFLFGFAVLYCGYLPVFIVVGGLCLACGLLIVRCRCYIR